MNHFQIYQNCHLFSSFIPLTQKEMEGEHDSDDKAEAIAALHIGTPGNIRE